MARGRRAARSLACISLMSPCSFRNPLLPAVAGRIGHIGEFARPRPYLLGTCSAFARAMAPPTPGWPRGRVGDQRRD